MSHHPWHAPTLTDTEGPLTDTEGPGQQAAVAAVGVVPLPRMRLAQWFKARPDVEGTGHIDTGEYFYIATVDV